MGDYLGLNVVLRCLNGKNVFVRLHIHYTGISKVMMFWGKAWCVRVEGQGKTCQSFNIDKTFPSNVCKFLVFWAFFSEKLCCLMTEELCFV